MTQSEYIAKKYGDRLVKYISFSAEQAAAQEVKKQMWLMAGIAAVSAFGAVFITRYLR